MTAPFVYLDAPPWQDLNSPPAMPTFLDGQLIHQADLNALSANVTYLNAYALGRKPAGKPLTVLRQLTPQLYTSGSTAAIKWDTVDKNLDSAWNFATDPYTVSVQTAGIHRIYLQYGINGAASNATLSILINGTDLVNNSAALVAFNGAFNNVEVTLPLQVATTIQTTFQQTSGANQTSTSTFGGCRLEVEWLCP